MNWLRRLFAARATVVLPPALPPDLAALPVRPRRDESLHRIVELVPLNTLHESGWRNIAVVGCDGGKRVLLTDVCDVIHLEAADGSRFHIQCDSESGRLQIYSTSRWQPNLRASQALSCIDLSLADSE